MRRALLDVNVLLALMDSDHVDHRRTHEWLGTNIKAGWASCAITQNGCVRVLSQPQYPSPVRPAKAIRLLGEACRTGWHGFWPCDVSLLGDRVVDRGRVHGPGQITDAYLLALAVKHDGHVVTFDRAVALSAVRGARESHLKVV